MNHEHARKLFLGLSALLLTGCGSQPLFQVETVVHGDGSCERTIWQPEQDMLPPEASREEWKSRWTRVGSTDTPPAFAEERPRDADRKYFTATGTFRRPVDIPVHFHNRVVVGRESAVGHLERSYERLDHTFVIEHRWRETLTNIVSREGFTKARDQATEIVLELISDVLKTACASRYEAGGLIRYIREEGSRFLHRATDIWYEHLAGHRTDEELTVRLARLAKDFGLDLLDESGSLVEGKERYGRIEEYLRHRIVLGIRHRDGRRLAESELRDLTDSESKSSLSASLERYWREHKEDFEARLSGPWFGMSGLYSHPLGLSGSGNPRFAFAVTLPGELFACNGSKSDGKTARWTFDGDRSFPGGYTMEARSLEIDRPSQERILGAVPIGDFDQGLALVREAESSPAIRKALGEVRASGSLRPLDEPTLTDDVDRDRLTRVRRILGLVK